MTNDISPAGKASAAQTFGPGDSEKSAKDPSQKEKSEGFEKPQKKTSNLLKEMASEEKPLEGHSLGRNEDSILYSNGGDDTKQADG